MTRSILFCGLARGNVTACRTYFCVLPAVAFSRALEREEKRRLKAAEPEDVTAAVLVLDRNKRLQIFTTLLTVISQHQNLATREPGPPLGTHALLCRLISAFFLLGA
ncbi:hypothetical protein NDU88_003362 [Pleurodeles waltl]|uniref:Uncharacterized protein n=1 Tax=Pleurodeles waltl TaxID=8319 RepID=A0AAV7SG75_PLEWA|nr:hypothetical protein NDU88_003362 [Pleurodeles waltl]